MSVENGKPRKRIGKLLAFGALILLFTMAIILSRNIYNEVWDKEYDSINEKTNSAADYLSMTLKDNLLMLKLFGRDYIDEEVYRDEQNLYGRLKDFSLQSGMTIAIIDENGYGYNSNGYNSNGEKMDIANHIDIPELMNAGEGITEPKHDTYFSGSTIFLYTKMVLNQQDYLLIGCYSTSDMLDMYKITFYKNSGYSYLIDKTGKLILAPENDEQVADFSNIFDFISSEQSKAEVQSKIENDESGYGSYACNGTEQYTLNYVPVRNVNDWYLVTVIPQQYINRATSTIIYRVILICICFALCVVIVIIHNVELSKKNLKLKLDNAKTDIMNSFFSRISHEIRTPMNAIIGMTELSQRDIGDQNKVAGYLDNIKCASEYLLSLINNILDMSRIQNRKEQLDIAPFRVIDMVKTVDNVTSQNMKLKKIRMSVLKDSPLTTVVKGDRKKLTQVLVNIVSNAVKFSPEGGKIKFTVQTEHLEKEILYTFRIADEGIGIKKESLARIFKPFEQAESGIATNYGGSGLGLAISKSYIDLMHGTLDVESEYGQGTTFIVKVKLACAEKDTIIHTKENIEGKEPMIQENKKLNILLVDDNEMNLQVMSTMLTYDGHTIITAKNGQEALDQFAASELHTFDVILMDVRMPVMDGLEATRRIRQLDRADAHEVRIIALTANAFKEDLDKTKEAGMDLYITKPVKMDLIREKLSDI